MIQFLSVVFKTFNDNETVLKQVLNALVISLDLD